MLCFQLCLPPKLHKLNILPFCFDLKLSTVGETSKHLYQLCKESAQQENQQPLLVLMQAKC